MARYIDAAEVAKYIRADLKKVYPGQKFAVHTRKYSMGASIDVRWTDGPIEKDVQALIGKYAGATFDGMEDLKSYHQSTLDGEAVHFGSDFVHTERSYSAAFLAPVVTRVCARYGLADPGVIPQTEYLSARVADDPYLPNIGDRLSLLVWREAQELSEKRAAIQAKPAKTHGIAITPEGENWLVSGDTFPHRQALKTNGGTWAKDLKAWRFIGALPEAVRALAENETLALKAETNQADHFQTLADNMSATIENKSRLDGLENTARRARMAESRRSEGRYLKAIQDKLMALARCWRENTIPDILRPARTRKQVELIYNGRYPGGEWGEKDRKSLAACGLDSELLFKRAVDALAPLGDPAKREKTHAEIIHEAMIAVCRVPIDGFFPTPEATVNRMLAEADIQPYQRVLEPSAGRGDIVDGIHEYEPNALITTVECAPALIALLGIKGYKPAHHDFMSYTPAHPFEKVLMNPPFEHMQDIDHVQRAYTLLTPGGRLVALMSASPFFREADKAIAFRAWLATVNGRAENIGQPFTASDVPTGVNTYLVVIDKPALPSPYPAGYPEGEPENDCKHWDSED